MVFSLTILGSSSALPAKDRFATAHVLNVHERYFMIDCGEGSQIQMKRFCNIKYSKFNHIFISHLHGDHVFGLFGLISSLDLMGRTADLHIYAYRDLENILDDHLKYFGANMGYSIVFHQINPNVIDIVYDDQYLTVETIPLKHRIPTCGFLFREKNMPVNIDKKAIEKYGLSVSEIVSIKAGNDYTSPTGQTVPNSELTYQPYIPRSYAFCSDTMYYEKITEQIAGVDLLYHEATFLDEMKAMAFQTGHSTAAEAAKIAKMANVKRLLLGHFSSRYDNNMLPQFKKEASKIFPETEIAVDGQTYHLPISTKK